MSVKSTDAANAGIPAYQSFDSTKLNTKEITKNTSNSEATEANLLQTKRISEITSLEKREMPISEKIVLDAIEKVNKILDGANRELRISVHKKTNEIMVKVINSDTNEIVREIPSEKILDIVAEAKEKLGILIDERR